MNDLIIIGSGAAGLSAALYAGRYRLNTLLVEGAFGGETATAGIIENYPGVPKIEGLELMLSMKSQAQDIGVKFLLGWAQKIERKENSFFVCTCIG